MSKRLLIILLIFSPFGIQSQSFFKKGNGLHINSFYHQQNINYYLHCADSSGNIYTIYYDTVSSGFNFGNEYSAVRLRIFNGASWLNTPAIKLYSKHTIDAPRVMDIQYLNGDIYISGSFDSTDHDLGAGILKFSQNQWQRVASNLRQRHPDYFEINRLYIFGNQIMVSGNFDTTAGIQLNGLAILDNAQWRGIGGTLRKGFQNLSGTSNVFFYGTNDSLYCFNKDKIKPDSIEIGDNIIKKLGVLRNKQFHSHPTPAGNISALGQYKGQLLSLISSNLIYIRSLSVYSAGIWTRFQLPGNDSFYATNYLGMHEHNNVLYLFFQSPSSGIHLYEFDGTSIIKKSNFKLSDNYLNLDFHSSRSVYICGNFNHVEKGIFLDSFNKIVEINFDPLGTITGKCFLDNNSDGIYQNGEPFLSDIKIFDQQKGIHSISQPGGQYLMYAPLSSNLNLSALSESGLQINSAITLSNIKDSIYNLNIPMVSANNNDVSVYIYSGTGRRAKQGFITPYTIELNNAGNSKQTVLVSIKHDKRLSGIQLKNFTALNQNSEQFNTLQSIEAHSKQLLYFSAIFAVDSFNIGEKVPIQVGFTMSDNNIRNNTDTLLQSVVAAYDPNIKIAFPDAVVDGQTTIKYVIYFENLGNDTALNVTVIDTFGSLLSLSEVVYGGTSHGNVKPSIGNNFLLWHFENIKLPPRKTDSINNKGFVSFRSLLSKNAKKGDTIYNKAAIFFDYQKPVITNKAKVVFIKNNSIEAIGKKAILEIYPNPTEGKIHYKTNASDLQILEIYTISGQLVYQVKIDKEGDLELPSTLESGTYLLKASNTTVSLGNLIIIK